MPSPGIRSSLRSAYLKHIFLRYLLDPLLSDDDWDNDYPEEDTAVDDLLTLAVQLEQDMQVLKLIKETRYINPRTSRVPKFGNLHLAWEYAQDPDHHERFIAMLRVSPQVFFVLLKLIENNPVFHNNSNVPQAPVEVQLAVTLFRLGHFGNAASITDVARQAGISEGSTENYTRRCFDAIEELHDSVVRPLTAEEKEAEKVWMDGHVGFRGLWREGWVMYDGTIIPLAAKPGLNGDAYYTRKSNYGLNAQIGNVPSNLRIVDYSHGHTGSAHDAAAFVYTGAARYPQFLFNGEEFAWGDSAYTLTTRMIPVHKRPAADHPVNATFDKQVSNIRVRSEHCIGALKGRWQSLRGLRTSINSLEEHESACRWITIGIILHNLVIDVQGSVGRDFEGLNRSGDREPPQGDEDNENNIPDEENDDEQRAGEQKRIQLTGELLAYRSM